MLGACREPIGDAELEEVSVALDRVGRTQEATVSWGDPAFADGETTLRLTVEELGPATLIGGQGCDRPHVSSPASARLTSDDGALDESLEGSLARIDPQTIVTHFTLPAGELAGTGDLPVEGTLRVDVTLQPDTMTGSVSYEPPTDDEDGTGLALF